MLVGGIVIPASAARRSPSTRRRSSIRGTRRRRRRPGDAALRAGVGPPRPVLGSDAEAAIESEGEEAPPSSGVFPATQRISPRARRRRSAPRASPSDLDATLSSRPRPAPEDHRARRAHRGPRCAAGARRARAHRRRDLHREGRRRDEAPPAHRDREGAHEAASDAEQRERLDRALAQLEVAHIGTIHSLLRRSAARAAGRGRASIRSSRSGRGRGRAPLRAGVRRLVPGDLARSRPRACAACCGGAARGRDASARARRCATRRWKLVEPPRLRRAVATRPRFDREPAIDARRRRARGLARARRRAPSARTTGSRRTSAASARFRRRARSPRAGRAGATTTALEAELARARALQGAGSGRAAATATRAAILARRGRSRCATSCKAELDAVLERADADLAALPPRRAARRSSTRYEELKTRAGKLDFLDLLLCARDLLRADRAVRAELQARFTHLFVDEFQDTDPLQAEILLLLAADDPERDRLDARAPVPGQALPRRRSRSSRSTASAAPTWRSTRRSRSAASRAGAELLHLTTSFRSAPAIQDAVNAAFARARCTTAQRRRQRRRAYVALERYRAEVAGAARDRRAARAAPYSEWGKVTELRRRGVAPRRRRRVRRLAGPRERLDGERARRARRAARARSRRATCACFSSASRASATTSPAAYVRALEARRVPHVLVGGRSLPRARRGAGRCARAARRSSGPTTSSACTPRCADRSSRSPTRRCSPSARRGRRRHLGCSIRCAPATSAARSASATRRARSPTRSRVLRELHVGRNRRPIADTIGAPARGDARARRHRHLADRRAGARQRAPRHGPGAPLRGRRRDLVPRLRRAARSARPSAARPARRRSSRRAPRACGS